MVDILILRWLLLDRLGMHTLNHLALVEGAHVGGACTGDAVAKGLGLAGGAIADDSEWSTAVNLDTVGTLLGFCSLLRLFNLFRFHCSFRCDFNLLRCLGHL